MKERLVYLAKCFQDMMLLFVSFDEPGKGNQEAGYNPLYPEAAASRVVYVHAWRRGDMTVTSSSSMVTQNKIP
jgi:hypothetical protein